MMRHSLQWIVAASVVAASFAPGRAAGQFTITLNPDAGLSSNPAALAAFNRAAAQYTARFTDNATISINANLAVLDNPNTIGEASSAAFVGSYDLIRDRIVADAQSSTVGTGDNTARFLPTAAQFTATLPGTASLSGNIAANSANLKVLGFDLSGFNTGQANNADGTITFNSNFAFDYDNRDGVDANKVDFETVAAHEIGHVLGFVSAVDVVTSSSVVSPMPLDLFRFALSGTNPSTTDEFTNNPRNLTPGTEAVFDDLIDERRLSTGEGGDGRQASHWKDDAITGQLIGIMDPTLGNGVAINVMESDFQVFNLIGYDLAPVPEPAGVLLAGFACAALVARVRRRRPALAV